jgi:hypothetical protein
MLLIAFVSLALCALAVAAIATVARLAMTRFRIHPMDVLLLLGLAEWPATREAEPRRSRPAESLSESRTPRARPGPRRRRRAPSRRAHSPFPSRG